MLKLHNRAGETTKTMEVLHAPGRPLDAAIAETVRVLKGQAWPWYNCDSGDWPETIPHNRRVCLLYEGPYPLCGWGPSQWHLCRVVGFVSQ